MRALFSRFSLTLAGAVRVLTLTVLLFGISGAYPNSGLSQDVMRQSVKLLNVGVLATEGATRALEAWTPTIELLNKTAADRGTPYRFKMEPHTDVSLVDEMSSGKMHLFLGDPAAFVVGEVKHSARPILSIAQMWKGTTFDKTGAVIFTKADSTVFNIPDLANRRVMAVAENELMGWKLANQQLRAYRLNPDEELRDLLFSGGNQREVVYAVQAGLVDVGVVRAGVLEQLAESGAINLDDFRPVSPIVHNGFPFWVSTPLFPDWVLASLPGVDEAALALTIDTLLSVDAGSVEARAAAGTVWQAPQNYQAVHEMLISLRARPYENYLRQAAARIYQAYKWPVIALVILMTLSVVFLLMQIHKAAKLAESRKNTLQSEVRSKQFYRNAIEDHTVFAMLTKDGTISHVNDRFLNVLERSRGSLLNNPLSELLNETNESTLETDIMSSMAAGAPWQGPLQLSKDDGKLSWVQCTFIPVTSASNELSEIAIVASDVTKTREGVSETRFNNTLELIQDQVIVMRPGSLEIMYANEAAVETLIMKRMGGDWRGKKVGNFITKEDLATLKMRCEATEAGGQRRVTWEVDGAEGKTYEISLEYVQPDQDEPRLIAIYRDISARKAAEKAKSEFLATISHELRTPLTSMKGALGLAMSGAVGELPEKANNVVKMASTNCDRLVLLINDILDLEKIEAGKMDYKMKAFNLNELIENTLASNQFYADKFETTLRRVGDDIEGEVMAYGDASRLTQVMDNLLSNAAKFSTKGSEILVSLRDYKGRWRIAIRDFGSGIPAGAQATIFDKFTQADSSDTRSKGGTGLGLSIVKLIVEHHSGHISFASQEGAGTEFFVDLPILRGEEVLPIPAVSEGEEHKPTFSDGMGQIEPNEPEVATQKAGEALKRLVGKLQGTIEEIDVEIGKVTVQQVATGRGVVGQSKAMNWFADEMRQQISTMLERETLEDSDVTIIELEHPAGELLSMGARHKAAAEMMVNWFADCSDLIGGPQGTKPPRGLVICPDAGVNDWLSTRGFDPIAGIDRLNKALKGQDIDVIGQFQAVNDAAQLTIIPTTNGRLPQGWPVVVIVSRAEASQNGRGVVSKFSSGGGGGRRRSGS